MARKLDKPEDLITDVKEKAFQRAIFHEKESIVARSRVTWCALESPIDKNREVNSKSRGEFNLDLLGRKGKNQYIVCEVKFSCNHIDSPQDAADEAFKYFDVIRRDAPILDTIATHHYGEEMFSWTDIKEDSELWVVANAAYWVYWLGNRKKRIPEFGYSKHNESKKKVRCFSIDIPEDYFIALKNGDYNYKPQFDKSKSIKWIELFYQ